MYALRGTRGKFIVQIIVAIILRTYMVNIPTNKEYQYCI